MWEGTDIVGHISIWQVFLGGNRNLSKEQASKQQLLHGFCPEFLPWLLSMDCDLGYVSQINSYLPELRLVVVFIIAIESNLGQCPSPHPPLDLAPDRPGSLAEFWLSELSSYLFCDSPNGRVLQSGVSVSGSTLGKVQKYCGYDILLCYNMEG